MLPVAFGGPEKYLSVIEHAASSSFFEFVRQDLNVKRLNDVHKHLWLAGRPARARPLHHQLSLGRSVVLIERAELHLVWFDNTMYLKPLPEYLMDWHIWTDVLCKEREIFENAGGMLLSYMWLICSQSDLKHAHDNGLLSKDVNWQRWTTFSKSVLGKIDHVHLHDINPRYLYGELRLARLNSIHRLHSATSSPTAVIRGYRYSHHQVDTFIERNFRWLITAAIYVTVVLTAMQVGLGTDELRDNAIFNSVSYGFTVFSIIAPIAALLLVATALAALMVFNVLYALDLRRQAHRDYKHVFENPTLQRLST